VVPFGLQGVGVQCQEQSGGQVRFIACYQGNVVGNQHFQQGLRNGNLGVVYHNKSQIFDEK